MLTPYQFASNRPIDGIDLDGLEYLDSDENHVKINFGRIELEVANFNRWSRNAWTRANNNPSNWAPGEIGISREVGSFERYTEPINIPSDLESGVSMDNSFTPAINATQNPHQQEVEGPRRPLVYSRKNPKNNHRYNWSYKPAPKTFITSSPVMSRNFARGHIVVTSMIYGLKIASQYSSYRTTNNIKDHLKFAAKSLADVDVALENGLVPDHMQDVPSLSRLANYLLSGSTKGMSREEIDLGKFIWENISTPTVEYSESGMDNYDPQMIITNPYQDLPDESNRDN